MKTVSLQVGKMDAGTMPSILVALGFVWSWGFLESISLAGWRRELVSSKQQCIARVLVLFRLHVSLGCCNREGTDGNYSVVHLTGSALVEVCRHTEVSEDAFRAWLVQPKRSVSPELPSYPLNVLC